MSVCRGEETARTRFGVVGDGAGICYTRTGRRFFDDRKMAWAASLTKLPLIANGDLNGADTLQARAADFQPASAVMLGCMAIVQPWVFATWNQPKAVDLLDIWRTLFHYVMQDFVPAIAVRRIQTLLKQARAPHEGMPQIW